MAKWKVKFSDNESNDYQVVSFDSKKEAELWIKNQEAHERYDPTGFEVVDGPYVEKNLTEGKHWPEDYKKTAINLIKQSKIGQQPWYTDSFISQDVKTFINEFAPLSHKNSNLGFFMAIVRWFIEYVGSSKEKYQEFIERKLDGIIATLLKIRADKSYDSQAEAIKKMSFSQFEKLMDEVNAKASSEKIQTAKSSKTYKVIPIYLYEELHEKYGGPVTGYKGESEWCHTNGKSTYDSWTKNGTQMFFVIEQDGWKDILPPDPKKLDSAYDEYGMSLIAILVDVASTKLLNSTLRWNHVILPKSGAADTAFESWKQLDDAVGVDVKKTCEDEMKSLKQKLQAQSDEANAKAAEILKNANTIEENTIPNSIKNHLTKVDIPKNVTSIEDWAFSCCSRLTNVTIPDSVTRIGNAAFRNCTNLASMTIPDSVTSIGWDAFRGCRSLKSVTIPDSVTSIKDFTFSGCSGLTSVTIGNSVKGIGAYAFQDCNGLTSVTIPDSVTSIGTFAFRGCSGLMAVYITDIAAWCRISFKSNPLPFAHNLYLNGALVTNLIIPDGVMSIEDYAFWGCSSLTSVTIPDGVTSIGEDAFYRCTNLTSVTIGNGVTRIGDEAFFDCINLKDITFKGKRFDEVKLMAYYPWGIEDESVIKAENSLNEANDYMFDLGFLIESCVIASGHTPSYTYSNEQHEEASKGSFEYDVVKKSLRKGMSIGGVWTVGNWHHHVAEICGGSNGMMNDRRKWIVYLQEVEQFISCMLEYGCGDVWLLNFENDSLDDVWHLSIGFTLLSSPFEDDK